ncbi:amidohydrolase [Neolewinella lacunae]|uniref:Amidohydrolase n=1 Tax=Neolewinella lacunae TaxID=1517758 RepID=A0A923PGD6_9BACT|nr:amidohydrolase [Neolewinella lacunae]MBC6993585.1 amidohydrolase [Neolewinella lacunae]MDN3633483.1 amidohydrolase [Neolewinella lacunae]
MKRYLHLLTLLLASLALGAQTPTGSVHIKNGTVLTITNGVLTEADVVVENGKITGVGKSLRTPAGAKVIDATGQFVMPGIIDAHSHIALDAVNEATNPVTAEVWTGDVLDPFDISIYRALAGGVTAAHAMHGSANAIGGQCETIKLRYGTYNPEDLKMQGAPRTIKFALGENPMRVHGEGNRILPRTRMGVEHVFRQAFSEAKDYMAAQESYQKKKASDPTAVAPKYDYRMETLADILRGEIIIHCHSYRADEILMLLEVCKDFGIKRLVFQHTNEGFKVAPELAEFGAMASVFADWWAYKFEVYYSTAYNAAILTRNGVVTSINSDSEDYIRHLYHQAGKTQRYGQLTDDEALRLITLNPAIQLGIDARVGSLEKGKDGDIAIFSAHPLSIYAVPQMTIVDGIVRFDIKADDNDMRLSVDPEKTEDMMLEYAVEHRCMEGVEGHAAHHH